MLAGKTCSESDLGPGPPQVLFRSLKNPRAKGRQPPTPPPWDRRTSATASPGSGGPIAAFAGRVQQGSRLLNHGDWRVSPASATWVRVLGLGDRGEEQREVS